MEHQGSRRRRAGREVPVGLERVLYAVATDAGLRAEFFADREAALAARGVRLREAEGAMLRAIPEAQLRATVRGLDTSPENLRRRGFLRAVAATAVTLTAADVLGGCSDDVQPPDGGPGPDGAGADSGPVADGPLASDMVFLDGGVEMSVDGIRPDAPVAIEGGVQSDLGSYGIRPHD